MYKKINLSKGFSLMELLVVMAIIGILASIVMASMNSSRTRGRDAKRVADIANLQFALELYIADNGAYPTTKANLSLLVPNYIVSIPVPPDVAKGEVYYYTGLLVNNKCKSYHLGANLEFGANNADSDIASSGSVCTGGTDFNGDDTTGCGGQASRYCYDLKR